jgi:hypothetical protein
MNSLLIETHYLPSIEYFCAIQQFDNILLEKQEHYVKQSYRNRCYIMTGNGVERLVVPLTGKHGKVSVKDVRVEAGAKWRNNQWRTIQSAYANAPFFEHYSDEFHKVIYTKFDFLWDLNLTLLSLCLRNLGLEKSISETVTYEQKVAENIFDFRSSLNFRNDRSGHTFYQPRPYTQVFGSAFASNLSLLDLLFCQGPDSPGILKASRQKDLNK